MSGEPKTHKELVAEGQRDECDLYGLIPDSYICVDCGMDTLAAGETFMANNDLWATAGAGREFLCVECFELRLGRHLTPGDFRPEVPINWQGPLGQTELSDGRADVSELGRALIDAKAAGELLNVPTSWVLAEARANRIPHVRLGRYVRFDAEELLEWCKSQHRGPGQGR